MFTVVSAHACEGHREKLIPTAAGRINTVVLKYNAGTSRFLPSPQPTPYRRGKVDIDTPLKAERAAAHSLNCRGPSKADTPLKYEKAAAVHSPDRHRSHKAATLLKRKELLYPAPTHVDN